jgi:hypothetical protein
MLPAVRRLIWLPVLAATLPLWAAQSTLAPASPDTTVYVTKTGAKYHSDGCSSLSRSKIAFRLGDVGAKYGPCSVCKPPVLPPATRSAAAQTSASHPGATVYVTKTGTKYHNAGCRSLARSSIPMKLGEAARVYGPCSICKPESIKR